MTLPNSSYTLLNQFLQNSTLFNWILLALAIYFTLQRLYLIVLNKLTPCTPLCGVLHCFNLILL